MYLSFPSHIDEIWNIMLHVPFQTLMDGLMEFGIRFVAATVSTNSDRMKLIAQILET
jgi:hypothetical protein